MKGSRRLLSGVAVCVAMWGFTGSAQAAGCAQGPTPNAAISVYVEQICTAAGSVASGPSSAKPVVLPKSVTAKVTKAAGGDAQALLNVASSPSLGASAQGLPATPSPKPKTKPKPGHHVLPKTNALPKARDLSTPSFASDLGGVGGGRIIGLALALLVSSIGAAVLRRREQTSNDSRLSS